MNEPYKEVEKLLLDCVVSRDAHSIDVELPEGAEDLLPFVLLLEVARRMESGKQDG